MLQKVGIIIWSLILGALADTAPDLLGGTRFFEDPQQTQPLPSHLKLEGKNAKATLSFIEKSSKALLALKEDTLEVFEREHKFILNRELFLLGKYNKDDQKVTLNDKLVGLTYGYHIIGTDETQMATLTRYLLKELIQAYVDSDVDCTTEGRLQDYLKTTDYHEKVFFSTEEMTLVKDTITAEVTKEKLKEVYEKISGKLDGAIDYVKQNFKKHSEAIIKTEKGFEMLLLSNYFQLRSIQHVLLQYMFKIFFTSAIQEKDNTDLNEISKKLLTDAFELFMTNLEVNGDKGKDVFVEFANAKDDLTLDPLLSSFAVISFSRLANMLPLSYETVGPLSGDVNSILSQYKGLIDEKATAERYQKLLGETSTAITTLKDSMAEQANAIKSHAEFAAYSEDISKKVTDGLTAMVEYIKSRSNSSLEILNSNLTEIIETFADGPYNKTRFDYLDATYYNRAGFIDFINMISKDFINSHIIHQFYYSVTGDRASVIDMDKHITMAAKMLLKWRKKESLLYEVFFFTGGVIKNVDQFLPGMASGTPEEVADKMSEHLKSTYPSCGFSVAATTSLEHFWLAETVDQQMYDYGMQKVSYKTSENNVTIIVFMATHQWMENKKKSQTIDIKTKITSALDTITTDRSPLKEVGAVIQTESAKEQFMSGAYGMHIPKDASFALKSTIEGTSEVLVDRQLSANPDHRELVVIVY